ncbi:hypothetical protein [Paucilactobacillus hokkaidonensis]|nr:hypothetical protein [Paucilactobacillus hokkaidonensis]
MKDDQSVHTINLTDKNQPHFDIVLAYRPQVNPLMEKLIDELQQPINL